MQPTAPSTSGAASPAYAEVLVTHDSAAGGSPGAALVSQLPLLVAIVAIFYFLVIRPQNQERKKHEALISSLKKDDDIVTQSGLYGRVTRVDGNKVELELGPKVRVWIKASAIASRQADEAAATDAKKES